MTGIWEGKPEARDGYSALIDVYESEAMDTWLEKLRAEWNKLSSEYKAIAERAYDVRQERDEFKEKAEKFEAVKSWYETRIKKYNEQIEEGRSVPPDITQYVVSGILLQGLKGLGEILEVIE